MADFSVLQGKTITKVTGLELGDDEVLFECSDGSKYRMYHYQECCEHVSIDDVVGDIEDILDSQILVAEEVDGECAILDSYESATWTFYKLDTRKGGITIKWYGRSNGYYSESVWFEEVV